MFNFFRKTHNRAMALGQIGNSLDYLAIQLKRLPNLSEDELRFTVLFLSYFQHVEVFGKMEEYNWGMEARQIIPEIGGTKWITLGYAISETCFKINSLVGNLGLQEEVQEIFDEGSLYEEMKKVHVQVLKEIKK